MKILRAVGVSAFVAGLWAGAANAATFTLLDSLAAGQGRAYVFDVPWAYEVSAGIQDRYTWFFPSFYTNSSGDWTYILYSEHGDIYSNCTGGICGGPSYYPTPDSYVSVIAAADRSHVVVVAENRTRSTPLSNCDDLTAFSICARQFDPAVVGISFNYGGDAPTYTVTSYAVPEPATWAMMIVGFGLVGSALRRRMVAA